MSFLPRGRKMKKSMHRVASKAGCKLRWVILALSVTGVGLVGGCGGGESAQVSGASTSSGSAVKTEESNVIVTADSPDLAVSGTFASTDGYLSRGKRVLRAQSGEARARFAPKLAQAGFYRVYLWWPQALVDAGPVDAIVHDAAGESRIRVDQKVNGGQWNTLGVFEASGQAAIEVELTASGGGTLVVDTARFEFAGTEAPTLAIETEELELADQNADYQANLTALGAIGPLVWSVTRGALPTGLTLDSRSGVLSGIATLLGRYEFTLEARDARGQSAEKTYTLEVVEAAAMTSPGFTIAEAPPTGTPPDLSNVISLLAAAPGGSWVKANLNLYSQVWAPTDLRPLKGVSVPTPSKIILAWSSFTWDPNRGDLYLYGGGHANYSGNDVYRWRAGSRLWERASLPSEIKQDDRGTWIAIDGPDNAPPSAHTYDNNMFFPVVDRMVVFGGAAYNNGGAYFRQVTATTSRRTGPYFFDPTKASANKVGGTTGSHVKRVSAHPEVLGGRMWQNRDLYARLPASTSLPSTHVNGCSAYAREGGRDVAYVAARSGATALALYRYSVTNVTDPSTDSWTKVGTYAVGISDQTSCGYDPVLKVLLRTGNKSTPFSFWNLNTAGPNNADVRMTPSDASGEFPALLSSNALSLRQCGFDFDPIRRQYALWCGDGRVWMVKPPASVSAQGWTIAKQPAPSGAIPNGDAGTGILGKWKYIHNLDAFLGLQDINQGNIWLYKPIGWRRPATAATTP